MKKKLFNFIQISGSIFGITGVSLLWFKDKIDVSNSIVTLLEVVLGIVLVSFIWAFTSVFISKFSNIRKEFLFGIVLFQYFIIGVLGLTYFFVVKMQVHEQLIRLIQQMSTSK